jgi:quercetin dioxygenase-like cupin family protein/DNA-binding XRE family transcriptional regulator
MNMNEQLLEIGGRLKGLRDIMGIQPEKMAGDMKLSVEEYLAYERGEQDFSFSLLYKAATVLGVDIVEIISGETPKLTTCALVRKGEGFSIKRIEAYDYKHLAFTFRNKKAEPFMVTVEPKEGKKMYPHTHEGQEFNYLVSGSMEFLIDNLAYELNEGDSVYYDASIPHSMNAIKGQPAKFIAVVIK